MGDQVLPGMMGQQWSQPWWSVWGVLTIFGCFSGSQRSRHYRKRKKERGMVSS